MTPRRIHPRDLAAPVLRSITAATGALAAGLGVAVPILAAVFYEIYFGRPSSTSGIGIGVAIVGGALAAALGGVVGGGIHRMVARTRWAGPADRRVTAILLVLVAGVPSILAVDSARRLEARNAPRVIRSSGKIVRAGGWSDLAPLRSATLLWTVRPDSDARGELRWHGRRVDVRVADDRLLLHVDELPTIALDISPFDYATEVYGVTGALAAAGEEWLALLVQLRWSGRRDLLFIFNPEGELVHEELLERYHYGTDVGFAVAGWWDEWPQEFVIDRGVPMRYYFTGTAPR